MEQLAPPTVSSSTAASDSSTAAADSSTAAAAAADSSTGGGGGGGGGGGQDSSSTGDSGQLQLASSSSGDAIPASAHGGPAESGDDFITTLKDNTSYLALFIAGIVVVALAIIVGIWYAVRRHRSQAAHKQASSYMSASAGGYGAASGTEMGELTSNPVFYDVGRLSQVSGNPVALHAQVE